MKVASINTIILLLIAQLCSSQVLLYKTDIVVDKNHSKTVKRLIRIQVNSKEETWLSKIEINHSPKQTFKFDYGFITDSSGKVVRRLKKKEITTRSNISQQVFHQDDMISEFDLYWNEFPYTIEYSYLTKESEYLNITWWTPLMYTNVPTLKSELNITAPVDHEISLDQSKELQYKYDSNDQMQYHQWKSGLAEVPKKEAFSKPIRELIPYVNVRSTKFLYDIEGSHETWDAFGKWIYDLNRDADYLSGNTVVEMKKLIANESSEREIIKKLYYYLQDKTKYVNVDIEYGGLKSYPAKYVDQNKYGDCKALTTYMKALLKLVDIDSKYVIVNAGTNAPMINKDFPSQQFNHVILCVPLENDTIWLENTSNSLPFNYLGTFTQDRYALLTDSTSSKLVKTPKLNIDDVVEKRVYTFEMDSTKNLVIKNQLKISGPKFESFRHALQIRNREQQLRYLKEIIGLPGYEPKEWNLVNFERDDKFIEISASGVVPNLQRRISKWTVINPLFMRIPEFEKPQLRKLDLRFNNPINRQDRSVFRIQNIGELTVELPKNVRIESKFGRYLSNYTGGEESIEVEESLILYSGTIPLKEYPLFFQFIQEINTHKKKSAILIQ